MYRPYYSSSSHQIAHFKVTEIVQCCNASCGAQAKEYCLELAAYQASNAVLLTQTRRVSG
jgi:hypothetical protein